MTVIWGICPDVLLALLEVLELLLDEVLLEVELLLDEELLEVELLLEALLLVDPVPV